MHWTRLTNGLLLAAAACALSAAGSPGRAGEDFEVTEAQVQRTIERGRTALLESADLKGRRGVGPCGLAVMALVNCGVSAQDARIKAAVRFIRQYADAQSRNQYGGTYICGVVLMVLEMTDSKDRDFIRFMTRRLVSFQNTRGDWGDFSRTQFAVLGLRSAERLGETVPDAVWKRSRAALERGQNSDGGWGYTKGRASYGSMTAAGVSSLYISGARLHQGTKRCGHHVIDAKLAKGLEWVGKNFTVQTNPRGHQAWHYYYLYALERVGVFTGRRRLGGHDWYREGASLLVRSQNAAGVWRAGQCSDAFAMLFLGKGSAPILVQKLKHAADWNPDPYDIPNLVEFVRKDLGVSTSYQTISMNDPLEDLLAAPVLYLCGHGRLEFSQAFRLKLRRFVEEGGFVFAFACCGREAFDKSFRAEMRGLFEGSALEKLPAGHPVYLAHHDLSAKAEHHVLEGIRMGCRTGVFYSRRPLCCAWDGCLGPPVNVRVPADVARRLGVNLVAYALGHKELRSKLARVELSDRPAPKEENAADGAIPVGQVFHEGGWNPFPRTMPNLSRAVAEKTGAPTRIRMRRVVVGRDEIFDYPVLYMTGSQRFRMLDDQAKVLRQYFARGGFLFADPACGSKEFDESFRKFVAKLYPDKRLTRLPLDHAIFSTAYEVKSVEYKRPVLAENPGLKTPVLEGVVVDGRLAVVYSPYNMGCELGGHNYSFSRGYRHDDAFRMAINILLYGMTY